MPHALVSGLGPNGMLTVVKLLSLGWRVTAVDARQNYERAIHVSVRQSYLDAVRALDDKLAFALHDVVSPIAEIQHRGHDTVIPERTSLAGDDVTDVRARLAKAPVAHVRLDQLERCFFAHLQSLVDNDRLHLVRGATVRVEKASTNTLRCRMDDDVVTPDLIVIAEGGKSPTALTLGRAPTPLSRHALYISVHVDDALGPITRRVDTVVDVPGGSQPVSFWATGHRDEASGTWLVLEVPDAIHAGRPSNTFDRAYFERAAMTLLDVTTPPKPTALRFSGTFRFEQQMLRDPTVSPNLVFIGDAAGMGHHALSTGLELGVVDLSALASLVTDADGVAAALPRYGASMVRSRVALLAFGMREYHPTLTVDPTGWIQEALGRTDVDPVVHVARAVGAASTSSPTTPQPSTP